MDTWTLILVRSRQILFVQFIYDSIQISKSTQHHSQSIYANKGITKVYKQRKENPYCLYNAGQQDLTLQVQSKFC